MPSYLDHAGRGAIDYVLVNSTPGPESIWRDTGATPVEILCAAVMEIIYTMGGRR